MIVARAPLRVPFAGGLTDLRQYAEEFGGVTVSATIERSAWVAWTDAVEGRFEVTVGGVTDVADTLSEVSDPLVRASLASIDPRHPPTRLLAWLEVPGHSGLGASGAICAALLHAALLARGDTPSPEEIGRRAARIEAHDLGGASGYHDANIAARGGLRVLEYAGERVSEVPLMARPEAIGACLATLRLYASGRQGSTKASLGTLVGSFREALPVLHDIKALAYETVAALNAGDRTRFAWCIGEQQRLKQLLPGDFEDDWVRSVVERARAAGATVQLPGGKIGGFVLASFPGGGEASFTAALPELREVPLRFTQAGASATVVR